MTTGQTPAALEQEIEQTRTELSLTINALEDKLTPRHLVDKGFDMVNDSIGGTEALNRGLIAVRANPLPFALIAIGAAWLVASNTGVVDRVAQDERIRAARRRAGEMASDLGSRAGEYATDMARRTGLSGNGADRPLGQTGHPLVDTGAERSAASGWVHQATGFAGDAIGSARDTGGALVEAVERNPLIVGGLGVVAGAILAMLMPSTRLENELLGGIRESFWRRVERAGQQAAVAARKIAQNAADVAADTAAQVARNAGGGPVQH